MFEIMTAVEMKKADAAAIESGVPGIQLMEAAGAAVAGVVMRNFALCHVLVLCGAGNNGGDGFIVAARLKSAGWNVRLACTVKKNMLKGDAALAAKKWDGDTESLNSNLSVKADLIVDAVYGTGFSGKLDPEMIVLFDKIRAKKIPIIAIDVPSGIDATAATIAEGALQAEITVTFCRKKNAHVLLPAKLACGRVHIAHIGIDDKVIAAANGAAFENHPALWLRDYPLPGAETHKYQRGHVVVYGGASKTGAACLAAHAAQRAGAGVVTIACRPDERTIYAGYRASLITDAWQTADDFKSIVRDERKNAAVIGCGAGVDEHLKSAVETLLSFNKKIIFDADVFSLVKENPKEFFAKLSPEKHVLTPHAGEFERLFPSLDGNKIDRARQAAKMANAVIVYKGADTVIAAPDGAVVVNASAPAILATAGSGDVLAGIIGGLASQGMNLFMASAAAVWLQAEAARAHGLGLVAEDIIFNISHTLNKLFGQPPTDS